MLSAIRLSVTLVGRTTASNVASASVMLCATVNEVTILTSERKLAVATNSPTRNARWSYPVKMCSTPSRRKLPNVLRYELPPAVSNVARGPAEVQNGLMGEAGRR